MAKISFYLNHTSAEIETAEKRYDVLPIMNEDNHLRVANYCLSKTLNLAKKRMSFDSAVLCKLEQSLREARDWAVKIYKK